MQRRHVCRGGMYVEEACREVCRGGMQRRHASAAKLDSADGIRLEEREISLGIWDQIAGGEQVNDQRRARGHAGGELGFNLKY